MQPLPRVPGGNKCCGANVVLRTTASRARLARYAKKVEQRARTNLIEYIDLHEVCCGLRVQLKSSSYRLAPIAFYRIRDDSTMVRIDGHGNFDTESHLHMSLGSATAFKLDVCQIHTANRKPDTSLQSMDPSQYKVPPLAQDDLCIAPTKKAGRCQLKVSKADLSQAHTLMSDLAHFSGDERKQHVERIILLHVCNNTHREKPKANETYPM